MKILKECPSCGFNRFNSARAAKGLPPLAERENAHDDELDEVVTGVIDPVTGCFIVIITLAFLLFLMALLGGKL